MARSGRKTQEMRHVSFRMPADVHQDYVAVAESRGVDLSALLNWVVVEYRPLLLLRHADNRAGMLRAAAAGLPLNLGVGPDPQEAINRVNELIRQLQEVASKLSRHTSGDGSRPAA
jgi:hypothetical protein